eukprot:gene5304-3786_t
MKSKFTSADVRAILAELLLIPGFIGSRVVNVYDLSQKTYIFKFSTVSDKVMLLVDAGFRFHATTFQRALPDAPSPFTMILRKLRRKRLDSATQLGFDRVIDLQFSGGDGVNHLLLEFYAQGNIVLTDENYEVLALLRSHQFDEEVVLKVGEIYPVAYATQLSVQTSPTNWNSDPEHPFYTYETMLQWLQVKADQALAFETAAAKEGKKKGKAWTLQQLLLAKDSGVSYLGPDFLVHALKAAEVDPNWKLSLLRTQITSDQYDRICREISFAWAQMEKLREHREGGYIIYNEKSVAKVSEVAAARGPDAPVVEPDYEEFVPFLFAQHADAPESTRKHFKSFNEAVDTFFFRAEEQKLNREWQAKEDAARKKLQNVQEEHERMLQGLGQQQRELQDAAMLLDVYADDVDKVSLVINSALQAELTWPQIEDMVALETRRGNPIASLISRLKLQDNAVVLKLSRAPLHDDYDDEGNDSDSDNDRDPAKDFIEVEIDLSLSAHANVSRLYTSKKAAYAKEVKTVTAATKVMENLKQQTAKMLEAAAKKPGSGNASTPLARKVHWFEKFNWFVTSEGFLVLSGRDAHQNDQLIRRNLRPEDVYVHADLAGAASCIVKARRQNAEDVQGPAVIDAKEKFFITPLAIQEAGVFAVCRSRAWQAKLLTSAYWVRAGQVSKKAPSGEYLSTGSFMIYGKKNYLPPMPLEMGFGVLFRVADENVARHNKERRIKAYDLDSETASTLWQESEERYGLPTGLDIPSTWTEEEIGQVEDQDDDGAGSPLPTIPEDGEGVEAPADDAADVDGGEGEADGVVDGDGEGDEEEGDELSDLDEDATPATPAPPAPPAKGSDRDDFTVGKGGKHQPAGKQATKGNAKGGKNDGKGGKHNDKKAAAAGGKGGSSKGGKGRGADADEGSDDEQTTATGATGTTAGGKAARKKTLNKKKARRYAEQDDEDRELAMLVLGHASKRTGETLHTQRQQQEAQQKQESLQQRQEKVGVRLLPGRQAAEGGSSVSPAEFAAWAQRLSDDAEVQDEWKKLFVSEDDAQSAPLLASLRDIADAEIRSFSILPREQALEVLTLFRDGLVDKLRQGSAVQQKSHFLAGIIRRILRQREVQKVAGGSGNSSSSAGGAGHGGAGTAGGDEDDEEDDEAQAKDAEASLSEVDDLAKLVGAPHPDDQILYAVPVCGPYLSLQSLRYKVKLTPGTLKKGKAVKTAIELFSRGKDVTAREKQAMKALGDNELVAVMIGDVKLSMPGLQQQQKQMKKKGKKGG